MTEREIKGTAESMQLRQLKEWADSLYFPADQKNETRRKSEIVYQELMHRGVENLSPEEEKIMAAGYSNYATYLIFDRNDPVQAYSLLRKSLELMDKYRSDGLLIVGAYTTMAHLYANFHDTRRALSHLETGFRRALESRTPKRGGYIYSQLLLMAWEADMLEDIVTVMQEFNKRKELKGGNLYDYNIEITKGAEAYIRGDFDEAAQHLQKSTFHIDPDFDAEIYLAMTKLMMADTYLRNRDMASAKVSIERAEEILDGYNELNGTEYLGKIKSRYYRAIGREDLARQSEYLQYQLRDSLYSARSLNTISDLEQNLITSKYSTELREAELGHQVLQEKNKRQRTVIILILITSVIVISLLLILIAKGRKLNEARYDLIIKDIDLSKEKKRNANQILIPTYSEPAQEDEGLKISKITQVTNPENTVTLQEEQIIASVYKTICEFMESSKEIYEPGFSIEQLSESLGMPLKQISRAINHQSSKNFSLFLSEYRIKEACRILHADYTGVRPTIEQVAEQVGYRSRSHFSRTFKSVTGLTTTEFLRQKSQRP